MNKKIKILCAIIIVLIFYICIIYIFQCVIPDKNLPIIETKTNDKKIENEFINDKDSIYEILRDDSKVNNEK